jgi:predicted nicotinamide N-methyase
LELGAGTGAVSLCLLAAGVVDYAVLTDIPDMLPHLQSNAEHNSGVLNQQRALVLPLRWSEAADVAALQRLGQQQQRRRRPQLVREALPKLPPQLQPPFDLIVGSDLIYYRCVSDGVRRAEKHMHLCFLRPSAQQRLSGFCAVCDQLAASICI